MTCVVFVACDSLRREKELYAWLKATVPDLAILHYNSESAAAHKTGVGECNTLWREYDAVLTSPTITYGVDFTPSHFDRVYGFFGGQSITAPQAFQMLCRIRHTVMREIRFTAPCSSFGIPVLSQEQLTEALVDAHTARMRAIRHGLPADAVHLLATDFSADGRYALCTNDPFTRMVLHTLEQREASIGDFVGCLMRRIGLSGGHVVQLRGREWARAAAEGGLAGVEADTAAVTAAALEAWATDVAATPLPTDAEYAELRKQRGKRTREVTEADKHAMVRYEVAATYGTTDVSPEFVLTFGPQTVRQQHLTFFDYCLATPRALMPVEGCMPTDLARGRGAKFIALDALLECLGVTVGQNYVAIQGQQAKGQPDLIRRLLQQTGLLFGRAGRCRARPPGRVALTKLLQRVLNAMFPYGLLDYDRTRQTQRRMKRPQRYDVAWCMARVLTMLRAHRARNGDPSPLKTWAVV